jgi:L-fucose mutarotase
MLKGKLLHPEILGVLGQSGHGSKILISDGNYPHNTGSPETSTIVFLNLMPGVPTVTQVLEALISAIPIEAAEVMMPSKGPEPSIFAEFRKLLPEIELIKTERMKFYENARDHNTSLVIATGEQRIYANLLLTIGVVKPPKE